MDSQSVLSSRYIKAPVVSLSKKLQASAVLVDSRNRLERDAYKQKLLVSQLNFYKLVQTKLLFTAFLGISRIKLTGRQKLASFLCFSYSKGDFMIVNAVCANDIPYGLFKQYLSFTKCLNWKNS